MSHILNIGITLNKEKKKAVEIVEHLVSLLDFYKCKHTIIDENSTNVEGLDVIFVLGGDGTLLGAARRFSKYKVPMIAINAGHLGFLSESDPENLNSVIEDIVNNKYQIERRLMINGKILRKDQVIDVGTALNDICIVKDALGRLVRCDVHMDDLYLGTYSGDGVIVATPTGSTAYSLSCGGPLVYPASDLLLVTPICPHMLSSRSFVLPAAAKLRLQVSDESYNINIVADGQISFGLQSGDIVNIERSSYDALLIKWPQHSFFEVVKKKLYPKEF